MKNYEITEENVSAAFEAAKSDETKEVLAALFGEKESKPDLDDYKSIKTYEDACEALGEQPVSFHESIPKHIAALVKLETISKALWGKTFQPKPDADGFKDYYYPQFEIYSEEEFQKRGGEESILHVNIGDCMSGAWFGVQCTNDCRSNSLEGFDPRLQQETREKAIYFGEQFVEVWADYLAFNFTIIK